MTQFNVNPYDFQNPVLERDRFAGRRAQLRDIEYYLDQATRTRPTNLAIVGPRAAGKTSLLNMIARGAKERGFVAVRINFTEEHGRSQLAFFFKIFDALVHAVMEHDRASDRKKVFGGRGGAFYAAYIQTTVTHQWADWGDLELYFPNLYATAMKAGKQNGVVSHSTFEDDLKRISAEVGKPIVLLMDECNVFIQNREILQAMRAIFQGLPGYMLVMGGTDAMFPEIDDVYSPVGRGFKRIVVEGFTDLADTWACMERPCVARGIANKVLDVFRPGESTAGSVEYPDELHDLHRLTAGNPHEIQLVCHFMFKEMQEQSIARGAGASSGAPLQGGGFPYEPQLWLTRRVIDRVLEELSADSERRVLRERIRAMKLDSLVALSVVSAVGFGLTRDEYGCLLRCDREFGGRLGNVMRWVGRDPSGDSPSAPVLNVAPIEPANFESGLERLIHDGWVDASGEGGRLQWPRDPMREVLIKYEARARGVKMGGFARGHGVHAYLRILAARLKLLASEGVPEIQEGEFVSMQERIPGPLCALLGDGTWGLQLRLSLRDGTRGAVLGLVPADVLARDEELRELESRVARANEQGAGVGMCWSLAREGLRPDRIWQGTASDWLFCFEQPELLGRSLVMLPWHWRLCDYYVKGGAVRTVIERAIRAADLLPIEVLPNLGYMALALGVDGAKILLDRAADGIVSPLLSYNRAISHLLGRSPDVPAALEELSQIIADDSNDLRIALRLRCTADSISMYEYVPGEGSGPKHVGELVAEATSELGKVDPRAPAIALTVARAGA